MRVLALTSYPVEAAATRFRVGQFIEPLRDRGIDVELSSFLDSEQFKALYKQGGFARKAAGMIAPTLRRIKEAVTAGKYDAVLIQREAMMFGPGIIEWMIANLARVPLILDLDDATYIRYVSPTYGRLGSAFKFFGKTDRLIRRSSVVICGNRFIAEYAESLGAKTVVVPTVVDTDKFKPVEKHNDPPVIGWIGTHSTFPLLTMTFPTLERLARRHRFVLRLVGSGRGAVAVEGVEIENAEWRLEREVTDFASLDIGLYPLTETNSANEAWIKAKSGFKAIQYMAVGVPFVMSPVGICAEIGEPGRTHFNATTQDDWYNSLDKLLSDRRSRIEMGCEGRKFSLAHFTLESQAEFLAETIESVVI
ncbi:MAG: glycosyltransferase [Pyrinomonadaceae bacterium]|nr:glycosyltransferase [Pyrinomonadaceae bacterium]